MRRMMFWVQTSLQKMMRCSAWISIAILTFTASCGDKPNAPTTPDVVRYQKELQPWEVIKEGQGYEFPFLGGINNPKPSLVDFDGDGLLDLMIGQSDGSLAYFRNHGSIDQPDWIPERERLGGIDVGTWHTFCDIDNDGDPDLFCDSRESDVLFYRNVSQRGVTLFAEPQTGYGGFSTGVNNTPTFADIDNDADLDFFYGAVSGMLEFHRNDGDAVEASFTFVTDFYDSILAYPLGPKRNIAETHGFSIIRFADIDDDSDLDLFWGDIFNPSLYFFINNGTPEVSILQLGRQDYLSNPTAGFNHPAFGDLDDDGDLDMILGLGLDAETNGLRLYRNVGTPADAALVEETSNVISQVDVGAGSVPTFGDLDNDGDYDMLVGGSSGMLTYFENTGSPASPSFDEITDNFMGIDVGSFSAPALVDWNGDGALDLLIGNLNGQIEYWRNDGTAENFSPTLVTQQLGGIKVDQLATPRPTDQNGDGLLDLVVGEWDFNSSANLLLYRNIGPVDNPTLELVTRRLIKSETREYTLPTIVDWNDDGHLDLIVGSNGTELTLWQNNGSANQFPDSTTFSKRSSELPGNRAGRRLSLCFVDIDGDGDMDVFVGEENGGINFYRRL